MLNYTKQINNKSGFTLIETIVALAIFSSTIVGLIVVSSQGIADARFAKNKLTASYLAQEGVEIVRNIRDTNTLNAGDWSTLISDLGDCSVGCDIDTNNHSRIQLCPTKGCELFYNASGFFVQSGLDTERSIFKRTISIRNLVVNTGDPERIQVSSTVYWRQGGAEKSLTMSSMLFNWQ